MNKYELMYIIDASATDEQRNAFIDKVQNMVTKAGGTVETLDKIGLKKFAYPINYKTEGFYVLMNFESEPSLPSEMGSQMKIMDFFVRSLFIKK